ncbi:MAG: hypothetical protein MAG431_01583 [Chloroflexi bacterium]|nr:hypothetical protein [Chloroflexota bacterium]
MVDLLYKLEVYNVIGAAMEVYNTLGPGFFEAVYQEALEIELEKRGIPFSPQYAIHISYNGVQLRTSYRADFLAYEKIIIEIKALDQLTSREEAQLLNYLKATGIKVGVLINFGAEGELEWERKVFTK